MYVAGDETKAPRWYSDAACANLGVDDFYPASGATVATRNIKQQMCGPCPVRSECLLMALKRDDMHGVWGGTSANERDGFVKGRLPLPTWTDGRHDKAVESVRDKRRNSKKLLTQERASDVQNLLARGHDIHQIAEIMGVTLKSVYKYRGMAA